MKSTLKYTISLWLLLAAMGDGIAQKKSERWMPSAVRVGGSVGSLGYLIFSEKHNYFETTVDVDFDRYFAVFEIGNSSYSLNEDTYKYTNSGRYMRLGFDVNFMQDQKHLNVVFFGLRYAWSSFHDDLSYNTVAVIESDTQWPDTREEVSNLEAGARWYEMNAGLKVRVFNSFYLGFTGRFKFLMKSSHDGSLRSYYIPGFGKNVNKDSWGLNYYIYYRIPFRKKVYFEKTVKPKKK